MHEGQTSSADSAIGSSPSSCPQPEQWIDEGEFMSKHRAQRTVAIGASQKGQCRAPSSTGAPQLGQVWVRALVITAIVPELVCSALGDSTHDSGIAYRRVLREWESTEQREPRA